MAQKDHLPLVFKFGEVNAEQEEIENKEEWGLVDMALNELAAAVAAPAPVPAPIPAPAPATIPVALTGWSLSTIAELEATSVREVSADPRELMYLPAPTPMPVRAPPPTAAPVPVRLDTLAAPVPVFVETYFKCYSGILTSLRASTTGLGNFGPSNARGRARCLGYGLKTSAKDQKP